MLNKLSQFLNTTKLTRFIHLIIVPIIVIVYLTNGGTINTKDYIIITLSFFIIDNLGLQVGYHKLLSHRSFTTGPFFINLLGFLGLMSGQGSPLAWVAIHRSSHHPFSDTDKDPHTPKKGFFYSFIAWYWNLKDIKLNSVKDLLDYKFICFIHRHHTLLLWGILLFFYIIFGVKALVIVLLIPMIISMLLIGLINSCLHSPKKSLMDYLLLTYKNHTVDDNSKNSIILGLLTAGLGYHNNHHHSCNKFDYAEKWYEIDFSKYFIYLIKK